MSVMIWYVSLVWVSVGPKKNQFFYFTSSCTNRTAAFYNFFSMICRQNRAIDFFHSKYFRETFFTEVTGTRISDHCVRNIYINVSLKIAVLWILVRSKILGPKILVNSFKNIYNKCSCRSSARNLFHLQFHFLRLFLYISNTYFQQYQECL